MSDMEPCPFCGGSVERIEPGGQLWRGQGYSDPQFWTLRHFGKLSETDAFPTCTIQIRERTEDAAIAAWNRRAAHARIEAQAALIAELTEALSDAVSVLSNCSVETGYCCCGDSIESHGIYSGHSPVDMGAYSAEKAVEKATAALTRAKEAQK